MITIHTVTPKPVYHPAVLWYGILVLGCHLYVPKDSTTFTMGLCAMHLTNILYVISQSWCVGYPMLPLFLCCIVFSLCKDFPIPLLMFLISILFTFHGGYLHFCHTDCRCSCSVLSSYGGQSNISPALCVMVLMMLYFAEMSWQLSQCKYWSMSACFLHTLTDNVLAFSCFINVAKNGIESSCQLSFSVTLKAGLIEFMYSRDLSLHTAFWMTNVSPTYLFWILVDSQLFLLLCLQILPCMHCH